MGVLKNFIEKYKQKREKEKSLQEDVDVQRKVMEKLKKANERELERYYEEERQKEIERQVIQFRKKKQYEIWHNNAFTGNKNLFNNRCMFGMRSQI